MKEGREEEIMNQDSSGRGGFCDDKRGTMTAESQPNYLPSSSGLSVRIDWLATFKSFRDVRRCGV